MGTRLRLSEAENLAETLDVGNFTTNGQQIEALNGGGFLNLRFQNIDDFVILANDPTGAKAYIVFDPTAPSIQLGYGSAPGFYLEGKSTKIELNQDGFTSYSTIDPDNLGLHDQTLYSVTQIDALHIHTNSVDQTSNGSAYAVFINTGDHPLVSTFKAGVERTVIIAGQGITAKTDDTLYSNQISLQESGNLFDTIIKSSTVTADVEATIQAVSGTLAYLHDISISQFAVNLDSAEVTVTRAVVGGRTIFTVTHNLGSLDIKPQIFRLSDGRTVGWRIERTGINTVEASRAGNVANGLFRILI